jgi:septum site-determining protein MinC
VWGKLRGLAHAGALGDESTMVCALELRPAQLRIAGIISRGPQGTPQKSQPEIAKIVGGTIVAEPWTTRE